MSATDIRAVSEGFHSEAIAFAWRLCGHNASNSYPLYPSAQALADAYRRAGTLPGGFHAACFDHGSLRGLTFGFAETETRYLQTTGFYVAEGDGDAAAALVAFIGGHYQGLTANVGLPAENVTVAAALALGFRQANHYRCYAAVL